MNNDKLLNYFASADNIYSEEDGHYTKVKFKDTSSTMDTIVKACFIVFWERPLILFIFH